MFKNAFLKENFKKWPHWPYIHITPTDDIFSLKNVVEKAKTVYCSILFKIRF